MLKIAEAWAAMEITGDNTTQAGRAERLAGWASLRQVRSLRSWVSAARRTTGGVHAGQTGFMGS